MIGVFSYLYTNATYSDMRKELYMTMNLIFKMVCSVHHCRNIIITKLTIGKN